MPVTPYPVTPELIALVIAFRNQELIADLVLPRTPVGTKNFKYLKFPSGEQITIPNTKVGRKGRLNEIEFSATEVSDFCEDFGLVDFVPQSDLDNAPKGFDPIMIASEGLINSVLLDREKRVADLVFALGTYPSANRATLSGTSQFSDYTNSDPIGVISDAIETPLMRPNRMVIGQYAWGVYRRHPKLLQALNMSGSSYGIASRKAVAELFELDDIIVGKSYLNSAKKGQTVTQSRVWGKHISLIYQDKTANVQKSGTFGLTAQFGDRVADVQPDNEKGLHGSHRVTAGESVREVICANDYAYFLQNVVA